MSLGAPYARTAAAHPFGTDALGRDVWSRVLWGGRLDLTLSLGAVLVATTGGVLIGVATG
jgi:peptide/nickel transport system permease protein